MTRRQCKKCPWRVDANPRDIPGGYCERKHQALQRTIDDGAGTLVGPVRMMACHETPRGAELPCVGWLMNQLGPGNNLGLRLAVRSGRVSADVELVGEQHQRFEDTLPRGPAPKSKSRQKASKADRFLAMSARELDEFERKRAIRRARRT